MTRPAIILALVAAAVLLTFTTMAAYSAPAPTGSGCQPDEHDALAIIEAIATDGGPSGHCTERSDTDCDGKLTIADALRILKHTAGIPDDNPASLCQTPAPTFPPSGEPTAAPTPTDGTTAQPTPTPTPTFTPNPSPFTPTPTFTATPSATTQPTANSTPAPPRTSGEPACAIFPADNPWNTDISQYPLHPDSDDIVDRIGRDDYSHPDFGTVWAGAPIGIPYVIVGEGQPVVPVEFFWDDESDPGPYPIPPNAPVEGQPVGQPNTASFGGDRHVIVIDESDCTLYETFNSHPVNGGQSWNASSGAVFDLSSNALRPDTWTSADAAGLPIFPGLVRYSEVVELGVIDHALRFTVEDTRAAFIHPATHEASDITDYDAPPMGMRFRMRDDYDCSGYSDETQVVCTALKKYGMFVADNGSDWYISGAPDPRWDDDALGDIKDIPGDAYEVVYTGDPIVPND
jgi:hypothetical protein